jgi:hypothetical protein
VARGVASESSEVSKQKERDQSERKGCSSDVHARQ